VAPSADRTASSWVRDAPRASRRLAALHEEFCEVTPRQKMLSSRYFLMSSGPSTNSIQKRVASESGSSYSDINVFSIVAGLLLHAASLNRSSGGILAWPL
jgi:hypothetical protein